LRFICQTSKTEESVMTRKLFIVAKDNAMLYGQLRRTVGREPDVQIIYDRRPGPRKPQRLARVISPLKALVRRQRNQNLLDHLDRRQRTEIQEEITLKGFAVIHIEMPDPEDAVSPDQPQRPSIVVERGARLPVTRPETDADEQTSSLIAHEMHSLTR